MSRAARGALGICVGLAILLMSATAAAEVPWVVLRIRADGSRSIRGHGFIVRDWRRDDRLVLVTAMHLVASTRRLGDRARIEVIDPSESGDRGVVPLDNGRVWQVWPDVDLAVTVLDLQDRGILAQWQTRLSAVGRLACDRTSHAPPDLTRPDRAGTLLAGEPASPSPRSVTVLQPRLSLGDVYRSAERFGRNLDPPLSSIWLREDLALLTYDGAALPGHSGAALVLAENPDVVVGMHIGGLNYRGERRGWSVRLSETPRGDGVSTTAAALDRQQRIEWLQSLDDSGAQDTAEADDGLAAAFGFVRPVAPSLLARASFTFDHEVQLRATEIPAVHRAQGPRLGLSLRLLDGEAPVQLIAHSMIGILFGNHEMRYSTPTGTPQSPIERSSSGMVEFRASEMLELRFAPRSTVSVGIEGGVELSYVAATASDPSPSARAVFPFGVRVTVGRSRWRVYSRLGYLLRMGDGVDRHYDGFGGVSPPTEGTEFTGVFFASLGWAVGVPGMP